MRKGQAQIQESIIVIFIFAIIFAIALFGIYRYNISSVENIKQEMGGSRSFSLLSNLPDSPLVQYSELGDEKEGVDTLKILDLELKDYGFRTIEIKQTYPAVQEGECNGENYPACNSYILYNRARMSGNIERISIPVSLYFPLTKEVKLGILTITTYG